MEVIQSALWLGIENVTAADVKERFPVTDDQIAQARELLGEVRAQER